MSAQPLPHPQRLSPSPAAIKAKDHEMHAARIVMLLAHVPPEDSATILALVAEELERRAQASAAQPRTLPQFLQRLPQFWDAAEQARGYGRVLPYSETVMKTGKYEPLEELPAAHLRDTAAQLDYDRRHSAAILAHQEAQERAGRQAQQAEGLAQQQRLEDARRAVQAGAVAPMDMESAPGMADATNTRGVTAQDAEASAGTRTVEAAAEPPVFDISMATRATLLGFIQPLLAPGERIDEGKTVQQLRSLARALAHRRAPQDHADSAAQ
jgi:hypothetical protein